MKKVLCVIIAIVMLASVMTGCGGKTSTNQTEPKVSQSEAKTDETKKDETQKIDPKDLPELRVGTIALGIISVGVDHIVKNGWDVENGFKIKEVVFPYGVPINEAMAANTVDVATTGFAAVVGVPNYNEKMIGEIGESNTCALFVRKDSPIAKVKGINPKYPDVYGDPETVKGKQIICAVGSLTNFAVSSWLSKIGLKDAEVKIVNMDTAAGLQAFESGQADVVALNALLMYEGIKKEWVQVADYKTMGIKNYDVLIANSKTYDANKEMMIKFVKQLFRANDELVSNPEMLAAEAKEWADKNGAKIDMEALKWQISQDPLMTSAKAKETIGNMGNTLKELGQFSVTAGKLQADKLPIYDKNITTEILEAALEIKK
ncbi:MAG: hypothetical protein A2Y21_07080 [Clostridiales bacterium GWC2_40_7]|nr:MAG: hypothetical protein A2Y21_07080 [Clostridiales bacterium GWC2_40_7]